MNLSIKEFSSVTGVPIPTLYRWKANKTLLPDIVKGKIVYTNKHLDFYKNNLEYLRGKCKNYYEDDSETGVTTFYTKKGEPFYVSSIDKDKILNFGHTWYASYIKGTDLYYIVTTDNKRNLVLLHNFILEPTNGYEVDHVNRKPMDNTRKNLRQVTKSENCYNRKVPKHKKDELPKGVSRVNGGFIAYISINGKRKYLGFSKTPEKVIELRLKAESEYFPNTIF